MSWPPQSVQQLELEPAAPNVELASCSADHDGTHFGIGAQAQVENF